MNQTQIMMNNTENDNLEELKELEQKRDELGKHFTTSLSALCAMAFLTLFITFCTDLKDDDSIAYLLLSAGVVVVAVECVVAMFKHRRAWDAVMSMKRELGIPVKEKDHKVRLFSTTNPTCGEKLGKFLGISMGVCALLLLVMGIMERHGHLTFSLPEKFQEGYSIVAIAMGLIGIATAKYRPDLSRLSRVMLWASAILCLAGLAMYLMGLQAGEWIMTASWMLAIINTFRVDREVYFLELEDQEKESEQEENRGS